ncbi:hypothetical protein D3C78_1322060 [compost metagenome]
MKCSCGTQYSRLKTPFCHGVYIKGKPQMNVDDFVPGVNIMPFGNCTSLLNPAVQMGRVDINGVKKAPCTPKVTLPWRNGKSDKLIEGKAALLNHCTNMCAYFGTINIEDSGQNLDGVTVG